MRKLDPNTNGERFDERTILFALKKIRLEKSRYRDSLGNRSVMPWYACEEILKGMIPERPRAKNRSYVTK